MIVPGSTCVVDGCTLRAKGRGYCNPHYQRWYRTGDPLGSKKRVKEDVWERFLRHIDIKPNGCWEWSGFRHRLGYGEMRLNGTTVSAYRFAFEYQKGPVPKGLVLDHFFCDNPPCCNPDHVKPVTQRENSLRGGGVSAINARKTHCKRGHEFNIENTIVFAAKYGPGRECRICRRLRERKLLEYQLG